MLFSEYEHVKIQRHILIDFLALLLLLFMC